MRRRRVQVASPWRRFAAGILDVLALLPLAGLLGFAWLKLGRFLPGSMHPDPQRYDIGQTRRGAPAKPSLASQAVLGGLTIAGEIGLRNVRGPGERLLGIRRADARSGGPVSVHSAVIQELATKLSSKVIWELTRSLRRRESDRLNFLRPAMDEIRREHEGDEEALRDAMMSLYREKDVNPFRGCAWPLVGALAIQLPAFWSQRGQTLPDRLAGIVVVRD